MSRSPSRRRQRRALIALTLGASALAVASAPGSSASAATVWGPSTVVSDPSLQAWGGVQTDATPDGTTVFTALSTFSATQPPEGSTIEIAARVGTVANGNALTWSPAVPLKTDGSNYVFGADLSDDGTTALVLYQRVEPGQRTLTMYAAAASIADGVITWGEPVALGSGNVGALTMSDDGSQFTALVQDSLYPKDDLYAISGTIADGELTVGTLEFLATDVMGTATLQSSADGDRVVAAWSTMSDPEFVYRIRLATAAVSGTTATWSDELAGTVDPADPAQGPVIDLSADGSTLLLSYGSLEYPDDMGTYARVATISDDAPGTLTWGEPSRLTELVADKDVRLSDDGTRALLVLQNVFSGAVEAAGGVIDGADGTWGALTPLSKTGVGSQVPEFDLSADGTRAHVQWPQYPLSDFSRINLYGAAVSVDGTSVTADAPSAIGVESETVLSDFEVLLTDEGMNVVSTWGAVVEPNYPETKIRSRAAELRFPPSAPSAGVTRGNERATVRIEPPASDGSSRVNGYQVRCTDGKKTFTSKTSMDLKHVVRNLRNGVSYDCSARAKNTIGWSAWSRARGVTPSTRPANAPGAPELRRAVARPGGANVVIEKPEVAGGSTITSYQAQCVRGSEVVTSRVSEEKKHSVSGLTPDVSWRCSGRARNAVGWSAWSAAQTVTPTSFTG